MDPVSIILGVWCAIMAGVSAFADGKGLWKRWRAKRRAKRAAYLQQSQSLLFGNEQQEHNDLEQNLTTSPRHLQTEYTRLSQAGGPLFRRGDNISFRQLSQGLARFQQNLVQKIRQSVTAITTIDLHVGNLMTATDSFRTGHVSAMTDLFQRVNTARPIARTLGNGVGRRPENLDATTTCWCQQASTSFNCAFCGRTNVLS